MRRIRQWFHTGIVGQVLTCTVAGLTFGFFSGHLWGLPTAGVWMFTAFMLGTTYGLIAMIHMAARGLKPCRAHRANAG